MPSTIEYIFIEADYELKCNRYFYYININSNCYCGLVLNWVFPIGKWILLGDFIVSMLLFFFQLHAVSRTQQDSQREPNIDTLFPTSCRILEALRVKWQNSSHALDLHQSEEMEI